MCVELRRVHGVHGVRVCVGARDLGRSCLGGFEEGFEEGLRLVWGAPTCLTWSSKLSLVRT